MGVGEQLAVSLVVRVDAGQHVSKQPSQRVHVRSGVGLCEPELLWGSEAVGAQCLGVVRRIRRDGPGDAEVDQMRSVVGDNHVGWGDVPMDDAMPVQLGHGIAQLADQLCAQEVSPVAGRRAPEAAPIRSHTPPRNDRATRMLPRRVAGVGSCRR